MGWVGLWGTCCGMIVVMVTVVWLLVPAVLVAVIIDAEEMTCERSHLCDDCKIPRENFLI